MTIEEIFSRFPHKSQKLAQEMTNRGLHCVGCGAAVWETLEAGMLSHGFAEEDVEEMVSRLNGILAEKMDLSTISLTKRAADKFLQILKEEGKEGWGLRFGDKAAGCSGFEYVLDYSQKANDDDEVFPCHGIEIHVNKNDVSRLMGSEIDFIDGLNGLALRSATPMPKAHAAAANPKVIKVYLWMARLSTSRAASFIASDRVGWAWGVQAISSTVALFWMASAASAMSSEAWAPMMWTPTIMPLFASAIIFTNPSSSPVQRARELALKGNVPS